MQTNVVLQTTRDIYSLIRNTRNTRSFTQPVTDYRLTVQRYFNVYTRSTTIDNNGYEKSSTKVNGSLGTDFIQEYMIPKTVDREYEVFQNFRYRSKACVSNRRIVLKNTESYSQVLHLGLLRHGTPRTLSLALRHFSTNSASEHVGSNNIEAPLMVMTGIWKKLSECPPVEFVQNSLISLHSSTGLPWWATIVLATVIARSIVTIPLSCYQGYITAKLHNIKHEMEDIVKELKKETNLAVRQFKWTEDYARSIYNRSLNTQWNKLIVRDNCHPLKGAVLLIVQIPLWVILSITLRNLCYMLPHGDTAAQITYLEMAVGGFAWISNLTYPDPTFILPVLYGLSNLAVIEIHYMLKVGEHNKTQKYVTNFMRCFSIVLVPVAAYIPSCITLYWTTSSLFGIFQNLLLVSPKFRRLMRIPKTDVELENPYSHLFEKIRSRLGLQNELENMKKL